MAKRKTLGKGLNALLPDIASVMEEEKRVMPANVCNIEDIRPNPYQPRKSFDSEKIEELAASLRANGVIQPLVVRERPDGYELIAGERRWRAASMAGLREVPIVIKDVPDHEVLRLSLIENIQRENLNPMEEAEAYLSLTKEFDLSQESLADLVGKDRSTITNDLASLDCLYYSFQIIIRKKIYFNPALFPFPNNFDLRTENALKFFSDMLYLYIFLAARRE